jgi:hypothetical protein
MMSLRTVFPAAALMLALLVPVQSQADPVQLTLDRAHAVGDRYHVTGEAYITQEMKQHVDGTLTEEQYTESELNMTGVVEVLEVNDAGGVTRAALTVGEYDIEINDEGIELQQDRRIIAQVADGETVYRYENGDAIDGDLEELIDMFLEDLIDEDGHGGDANVMLNLEQPRSAGDRWEMNHEAMAADAVEKGELVIDADNMESEVHLVEINNNNDFGEAMAVLRMSMRVSAFTFAADQFPDWLKIIESQIEMEGSGMLPVEPTGHKGHHETEMEMVILARGKVPGQNVTVQVEVEGERGSSVTFGEAR